jgi:EAL domain-containing protein (putative c-di-GMP-specific phosphodiesterase class I)
LRAALAAIETVFRYQPQIDLQTGRVAGAEALVFLSGSSGDKASFGLIAQLEAAGLGLTLAESWLQELCADRRLWRRQTGADLPIGMPVSQPMLEDPGFLPLVLTALAESGLAASWLELEVPESALCSGDAAARSVAAANSAGLLIAIDRFTGARSSLELLTSLPFTKLRLDAELLAAAANSASAGRLVDATVAAARALGIVVCAAGVDTPELLATAERRGLQLAQGAALGPPSDGDQLLALVRGGGLDTASLPVLALRDDALQTPAPACR